MTYTKEAKTFLDRMKISQSDFEKSGVQWRTLKAIKKSFLQNIERYDRIAMGYVEELSKFENIHTVRYRIKDVDHLLEKIVRKTLEGEEDINEENYAEKITDIIGLRVLYVFKSDWKKLHDEIKRKYLDKFAQTPEIKIKKGDPDEQYRNIKNVEIKENLYRSIHYTLRHVAFDESTGNQILAVKVEIQTRSIFEEGWSEINHKLIYKKDLPDDIKVKMVKVSDILCTLAGECDQLGEVLRSYSSDGKQSESGSEMGCKKQVIASDLVDIMETYLDIPIQPTKRRKKSNT